MNSFHQPRRCRAKPRLDYRPASDPSADEPRKRKRSKSYSGYGVMYLRCGGGFRVLRRERLPGEDVMGRR